MDCLARIEVTTAHEGLEVWNPLEDQRELRIPTLLLRLYQAALWLLSLGHMQMAMGLLKAIKVDGEDGREDISNPLSPSPHPTPILSTVVSVYYF